MPLCYSFLVFLGSLTLAIGVRRALDASLKHIIQRPRPIYAAAFLHGTSYSFPSGHAMESLVGYGMLAYFLVIFWATRRYSQVAIIVASTMLIAAIGFSRLYLGVHYFSDV